MLLHSFQEKYTMQRANFSSCAALNRSRELPPHFVMAWLAFAYTQTAQWHLAQQECLEALALVEQSGARTIMAGYLYHFLFQILRFAIAGDFRAEGTEVHSGKRCIICHRAKGPATTTTERHSTSDHRATESPGTTGVASAG